MILFVRRMLQKESEADKREFIRGITGSEKPIKANAKVAGGIALGYLISKRMGK